MEIYIELGHESNLDIVGKHGPGVGTLSFHQSFDLKSWF